MTEQLPNTEEIEAFLKGKPVSDEFINELETHTGRLIAGLEAVTEGWNPDQACEEMAALFAKADEIFLSPHYPEEASTADMDSPGADPLPTDSTNR